MYMGGAASSRQLPLDIVLETLRDNQPSRAMNADSRRYCQPALDFYSRVNLLGPSRPSTIHLC